MKLKIFIILLLTISIYSCYKPNDNSTLNKLVNEGLNTNKNVEKVFLDLKFGMSKIDFEKELIKMNLNKKVKIFLKDYSYEFNNKKLKGINWQISSRLHNDSIIGINLHSFKMFWKNNYNSINDTYIEIINEYKNVYGEPSYTKSRYENYWIKDNLLISITKSNSDDLGGSVYIKYKDKRKDSMIKLSKCKFDEYGNSLDRWYYQEKEKNKLKNEDI